MAVILDGFTSAVSVEGICMEQYHHSTAVLPALHYLAQPVTIG